MDQKIDIGLRIAEERNRLGMNQADFGRSGGVSKGSQLLYEKGNGAPNTDYLAAIAKIGADIQYIIMGGRSSSTPVTPSDGVFADFSLVELGRPLDELRPIGDRLRELRMEQGLSQADVAALAEEGGAKGSTRHLQAMYENALQMPDQAYLTALAFAGWDVYYIVNGVRSPKPLKFHAGMSSQESDDLRVSDYVPEELKPLFDSFIDLWMCRTLDPAMLQTWVKMADQMNPRKTRTPAPLPAGERVEKANAALQQHKQELAVSGQAGKIDMGVFSRKPGK
ncbi:helix-turn-helix domain-containing protein [Iodobacter sp.]|uniref:helix-turn-helix domain-containing protein n=1 Tax=Iodobacter sp. TaxID=1915058 RepID=UPI0025D5FCB6|nr:helix-turn-helix transcriptional regulator [Iodobacter sp.]